MCASTSSDCIRLLQVAYRAAARICRNRVLAEEAGERAVHRFQLALIAGSPPTKPEAWVRTVARRSACAILRNGWARMQPIPDDPHFAALRADLEGRPSQLPSERLREMLCATLTARQREALEAALTCRTTRDAARACGMEPRDFRRYLAAITRRAHRLLEVAS